MSSLTFYRGLFMLELYLAEFLFIFRLKKRPHFWLRFLLSVLVGEFVALALPAFGGELVSTLTFLPLFALTVPTLKFCLDEPWVNVLFAGIAAYTTQHFAYSMSNFFMSFVVWGKSPLLGMYGETRLDFTKLGLWSLLVAAVYVTCYFSSYAILFSLYGNKIKRGQQLKVKRTTVMIFILLGLMLNVLLNALVVYFSDGITIFDSFIFPIYECTCCFFLLHALFGLVRTRTLEEELSFVRALLREKERQWKLTKESVNLINLKCHDLKHQIRTIGEGKGIPRETVREIEDVISVYDATVKTGNDVLDTILTEKSLSCAHSGIRLTCVADGEKLNFMSDSDLYSLFGNALDNAMEAVSRLEDAERRVVNVLVRCVGELVSVTVSNYYSGTVILGKDGFPVTGKHDTDYHGFGLRSIRFLAEKYGGAASVTARDGKFLLKVLFPDCGEEAAEEGAQPRKRRNDSSRR